MSARGWNGTISSRSTSRERPFRMKGDSGTLYLGDTLVIATGAQARWLNLPSEEHLKGKGVSRLRDLRRLLLPRQEGDRDRRRQHRGRGSALHDQPQPRRDPDPPPRLAARREDPAGPAVRPSQHQGDLEPRGRRVRRRRRARGAGRGRPARHADRRDRAARHRRRVRRDRPFARDRIVQGPARARRRRLYPGRNRARRGPRSPACSPAAT